MAASIDGSIDFSLGSFGSTEDSAARPGRESAGDGNNGNGHVKWTVSAAKRLIEEDSEWINTSKHTVFLVMFLAAVATSIGVFLIGKLAEEDDFKARFGDFSQQIILVSHLNALHAYDTYEAMSQSMTSMEFLTDSTWPNILFPDFEAMAYAALLKTGSNWVSYSPLVQQDKRETYEEFTYSNQGWIDRGLQHRNLDLNVSMEVDFIHCNLGNLTDGSFNFTPCGVEEEYAPLAQMSPVEVASPLLNFDGFEFDFFRLSYDGMVQEHDLVISPVLNLDGGPTWEQHWPVSFVAAPVYAEIGNIEGQDADLELVALVGAEIPWHTYFQNLIPDGIDGISLVVQNTCNQSFTYQINGPFVEYLGIGDLHEEEFDHLRERTNFTAFTSVPGCQFSFSVTPTTEFKEEYTSNMPIYSAMATGAIFLLTAAVFHVYDQLVHIRQEKLLSSAERTNAIVNSLFPENVRGRLIEDAETAANRKQPTANGHSRHSRVLGSRHNRSVELRPPEPVRSSKPIADLFPKATVLFADLVGFTAWSSIREPSQVFTLLETVYSSFDKIAKKLRVFKVETIGDCYVAATGLPNPRRDHAVAMARFARLCLSKLDKKVLELQYTLGPGTSELAMRIGMHSGPVTAGVLRGEKSRFQLFGDTVNTAARMESTGERNRIQMSQETADILLEHGKESWIEPRADLVIAKGKGQLQTYWLTKRDAAANDLNSAVMHPSDLNLDDKSSIEYEPLDKAMEALVCFNTEFLLQLLKKIVAGRGDDKVVAVDDIAKLKIETVPGRHVLDEVVDDVPPPEKPPSGDMSPEAVQLSSAVQDQLRDFVQTIASLHTDGVPFHSFEHSAHVCQSVAKLLGRMLRPDEVDYGHMMYMRSRDAQVLHEQSYGIASDPLTQFACGFAALVHHVDHPGVPNEVLVAEKSQLVALHGEKSISKQNSVEVSWELLMEPVYKDLRACIFTSQKELERFRCLVVNAVLSTDVWKKGAMKAQVDKWQAAFEVPESPARNGEIDKGTKRKAMAIVGNLLAASDHSHAMQHWMVYIKWNELMFDEMYQAYRSGRYSVDPSQTWYEDELYFFAKKIIPLAQNLKASGVFGTAGDEYVDYAVMNQREWEQKGKELVTQYLSKYPKQDSQQEEENLYDFF